MSSREITLTGKQFVRSSFHGHWVNDRVVAPGESDGSGVIRIVPVGDGWRVDYNGVEGRVYPDIRGLMLVDGKPLYIAQFPEGEGDFWNYEFVVYGHNEYIGPECVEQIVDVVDGEPVFIGVTCDDDYWYSVCHGRRYMRSFDMGYRPPDHLRSGAFGKTTVLSGMFVGSVLCLKPDYYYADEEGALHWVLAIGQTDVGTFDEEPDFCVIEWGEPMYQAGVENAKTLLVRGKRDGVLVEQRINIADISDPVHPHPSDGN